MLRPLGRIVEWDAHGDCGVGVVAWWLRLLKNSRVARRAEARLSEREGVLEGHRPSIDDNHSMKLLANLYNGECSGMFLSKGTESKLYPVEDVIIPIS